MGHSDHFHVGDVITIDNVPAIPIDMQWRVEAIVPGKGVRLVPIEDPFNAACGEYWITGPEDQPFAHDTTSTAA